MDRVRSSAIREDLLQTVNLTCGGGKSLKSLDLNTQESWSPAAAANIRGAQSTADGRDWPHRGRRGSRGLVSLFYERRRVARRCGSDAEAFAAATFALDVRIAELEGLVQTLLDEVDDGAIDQAQALPVNEDLHAMILEYHVVRLRIIRIINDIGEA